MPKKVTFHTLGCKLNFAETSTFARQFSEGGFIRAQSSKSADICIVNTCAVTEHAEKKCRNLIRKLIRENPEAVIAVTGCYAQLRPDEIAAIEGVDIVISNDQKSVFYKKVSELANKNVRNKQTFIYRPDNLCGTGIFAAFSTGDRTRAFLKVQDGCDYKCAYCTIHYARGGSRNVSIAEAVDNAKKIASAGQKEIVITGINTGDFGRTTGESFADLLRELDKVEGIERYRISSIEPNLLTDEIIKITKTSTKFQPHFHIPLQSGCDSVLARMGRRYDTALFADRLKSVRAAMPDAFIGIDVIVGFPGETDEDFERTYNFIRDISPAYLHVFPYSVRPGTPAAEMSDKVPPHIISERSKRLTTLCGELHRQFTERYIGTKAFVLFESTNHAGKMSGFTSNYIRVFAPYDSELVNTVRRVKLESLFKNSDAYATIL